MRMRHATGTDEDAIWQIFCSVIEAGDTYVFPDDITKEKALSFWMGKDKTCFVAHDDNNEILGTYIIKPNHAGRGSHIANASFMVSKSARGRGVGEAMGKHALEQAKQQGYLAMQFNMVVSTNHAAVKLWQKLGFEIIATIPNGFHHKTLGLVDAYIMFRHLL